MENYKDVIQSGSIACMDYLYNNGCSLNSELLDLAKKNKRNDIVTWLKEHASHAPHAPHTSTEFLPETHQATSN